ncbi:unnamed protein product [Rhizoctonia solani]|uniref:Uncharacterized protein n=1 Tax=Rhizoctonia solani TaxID=456999 RepID=A0A8H3C3R1_9AGAM|nr:unnamed protein product [Rhizoctonia solani]
MTLSKQLSKPARLLKKSLSLGKGRTSNMSNLPPWDLLSFRFGWDLNITTTIPQCSTVTFDYQGTTNGRVVNPSPTPPYNLIMYSDGFEPWTISMNNSATNGQTQWLANLPAGPTFAVSMEDSRGYSGGVLYKAVEMAPGVGCDLASPLRASSLDISIDGSRWIFLCRETLVTVSNGSPPYMLKFISLDHQTPKTMRFALSPFRFRLDASAGVEYWMAVYDSRGGSGVKGPYQVESSLDGSCLGLATTVTAGKFSTIYPGGTARPDETGGGPESENVLNGFWVSANTAAIMAVLIPLVTIAFASVLLRLCFKHSHRLYPLDSRGLRRIEHPSDYYVECMPAAKCGGRNADTASDQKSSGAFEPPDSAKLKRLVNPDSHHLGPVDAEFFDFEALRNQRDMEQI